jgi:hypothetical protein
MLSKRRKEGKKEGRKERKKEGRKERIFKTNTFLQYYNSTSENPNIHF